MQLTLNDGEPGRLRDVLQQWLPAMRREAAGTELAARQLRHELHQRVALCERLIEELGGAAAATTSRTTPSTP